MFNTHSYLDKPSETADVYSQTLGILMKYKKSAEKIHVCIFAHNTLSVSASNIPSVPITQWEGCFDSTKSLFVRANRSAGLAFVTE